MRAWQFAKAQPVTTTPFVSMQNYYNLVYREEEREMIPQCIDQRVAVTPWSPLGATKLGHLADALAAERLSLSDEEIARLEEPYGASRDRRTLTFVHGARSSAVPLALLLRPAERPGPVLATAHGNPPAAGLGRGPPRRHASHCPWRPSHAGELRRWLGALSTRVYTWRLRAAIRARG